MQYGSIGWSVGATLGYAQAVPEKRVIACIGDGSFQVCIVFALPRRLKDFWHHLKKFNKHNLKNSFRIIMDLYLLIQSCLCFLCYKC